MREVFRIVPALPSVAAHRAGDRRAGHDGRSCRSRKDEAATGADDGAVADDDVTIDRRAPM
jgi:hypothetical protein